MDLHSYSDETVDRLFGFKNCPDVCVGVEPDYYSAELVNSVIGFCRSLGLSTEIDYPYRGSLVPNRYFGHRNTGIVSIMLEINKRVLL
ncbi:MAG: N-formylglutamate amidohydrolase [Clostridiales bacterium]|nr:N-formylglutamate amidohydrolase [Clostridiales bacterium]MDD7035709.1 N-formylglutamate amidohydrolase [Bacillota bacterium]